MPKKTRSAGQPNPAIRLSGLPPRLARLFAERADAVGLATELDRLTDGLKPASFLPLLVGAFAEVSEAQRDLLDEPVRTWLHNRGLLVALRDLEERLLFTGLERELARSWLEAGGVAPGASLAADDPHPVDLLIAAYVVSDEDQASVTLFWHEDGRRRRGRLASFLIDFQPPWEGALKDIAYATFRDFDRVRAQYFASWQNNDLQQRLVPAAEATRWIWDSLRQSQAQGIKLPADFIAVLDQVVPFVLALPTELASPTLGADEIAALASSGRSPELLRREERLFGFQKRMPDGRIIRVMPPPEDL